MAQPPLARTVRDLVSTRIAVLPQDQLVALETVAATEPLPIGVAVELVGWASLEALESAGLVTLRDEPGRSQVTTAHPIFGDAIRADLPQLRLRRLRLAGARALESMPGPAPHDLVRAAMWRLDSGERGDPEWLLGAARAARSISLETSERLATAAVAAGAPVSATVLLAEILTHAGRPNEAATLLAALPPETLPQLRDALVYLDALHHGLLSGDLDLAADLVAGALSGEANASDRLQATYSSFLAFDARFEEALAAGSRVAQDPGADPESRTIAAMGVVGAHYWLGHGRRATELADVLMPIADRARDALPYGAPAIELIAICAMIDNGDLEAAMQRAQLMAERAVDRGDPFAAPRAEYCIARVHLLRGRTRSAARLFRRCVSALTPFDLTFTRHLHAMVARSEALAGDAVAGRRALVVGDAPPDMPPYEPDWALAEAALSAAELDLTKAADQAAYVAGIAAGRAQWTAALHASHDAARYGASNSILAEIRRAARHTDSNLAPLSSPTPRPWHEGMDSPWTTSVEPSRPRDSRRSRSRPPRAPRPPTPSVAIVDPATRARSRWTDCASAARSWRSHGWSALSALCRSPDANARSRHSPQPTGPMRRSPRTWEYRCARWRPTSRTYTTARHPRPPRPPRSNRRATPQHDGESEIRTRRAIAAFREGNAPRTVAVAGT